MLTLTLAATPGPSPFDMLVAAACSPRAAEEAAALALLEKDMPRPKKLKPLKESDFARLLTAPEARLSADAAAAKAEKERKAALRSAAAAANKQAAAEKDAAWAEEVRLHREKWGLDAAPAAPAEETPQMAAVRQQQAEARARRLAAVRATRAGTVRPEYTEPE